jgi:hypothetical protein
MAGLESFFGREDLSDLDVVIRQQHAVDCTASSTRKRSRQVVLEKYSEEDLVLPGHRLALCAASEVLNAQVIHKSKELMRRGTLDSCRG